MLTVWKLRPSYCQAILRYPTRINLDGSPTGEDVDDVARATAKGSSRRARRAAGEEGGKGGKKRLRAAAEVSAEAQAPEPVPTLPDQTPQPAAPPEQAKPRKLLVAGSAAMEAALQRRLPSGAVTTEI